VDKIMVQNKFGSRYIITFLANLLVFSVVPPSLANTIKIGSVFYISKSENNNQVHYGIKLNQNCLPVADKPVSARWQLANGKTSKIEPWEEPAYGIANQNVSGNKVDIALKAFKEKGIDRKIVLTSFRANGKCQATASTTINKIQKGLSYAHIDLVVSKKAPITGSTIGGTVTKWTLVGLDKSKEVIPCSSGCKFGI
jgi:Domain of unknown function (DUF4833)